MTNSTREHLELSPDEMRALGRSVVDLLVDHYAGIHAAPVGRKAPRAELETLFGGAFPEEPNDPIEILGALNQHLFPNSLHLDHPRFFAFVPSPNNFVSAMADALVAGLNIFAGTYFAGSGPAQIELTVIDWLRQLCGLPDSAGGLLVSGGSMANLTGLAVARDARLGPTAEGGVAYISNQCHSSIGRALHVLGVPATQIRSMPVDSEFRLSIEPLQARVAEDRAAGLRPFCVVANAGTTNTGAVDPLNDLASLCSREELWLHIDGAYGAPAVLTEYGRRLLAGMELADSLSLDPHKWLFQSIEAGCILVRDRSLLLRTFQVMPEYLRDTHGASEEVNFGNYGVQLTRSFRALKLWLSLKTFGVAAFRAAIARGIELAELAEHELGRTGQWEIVTSASLAVVTFRYVSARMTPAEIDSLHGQLVGAMLDDGYALATSTVLNGRPALRFCTINPRTTDAEMIETVRRTTEIARGLEHS
ncbi:MAG TPA: pyridoxal-dependent decarboxylase [Sphingomicrobium sp.]|nr:pyridoxal-dependent decarboxylase [Sphingomicrobium sp.]